MEKTSLTCRLGVGLLRDSEKRSGQCRNYVGREVLFGVWAFGCRILAPTMENPIEKRTENDMETRTVREFLGFRTCCGFQKRIGCLLGFRKKDQAPFLVCKEVVAQNTCPIR